MPQWLMPPQLPLPLTPPPPRPLESPPSTSPHQLSPSRCTLDRPAMCPDMPPGSTSQPPPIFPSLSQLSSGDPILSTPPLSRPRLKSTMSRIPSSLSARLMPLLMLPSTPSRCPGRDHHQEVRCPRCRDSLSPCQCRPRCCRICRICWSCRTPRLCCRPCCCHPLKIH